MNFGTIKTRVTSFLDRADSDVDTLVGQFVNDIRHELALEYTFPWLYKEATVTTTSGTANYAYPTDYIGHLSIFIRDTDETSGGRILGKREARLHDEWTQANPNSSENTYSTPGAAKYYVERGAWFELIPTPDDNNGINYTLEIRYYAYPADFDSSLDYDRMSNLHYNAIINGATLRGAIYWDDQDKIKAFAPLYQAAVMKMVQNEKSQEFRDGHARFLSWRDFPSLANFKRRFNIGNQ